MKMIIFF